MSIVKNIYRSIVPEFIRQGVYDRKRIKAENKIKNTILEYYRSNPSSDKEINEGLGFLKKNSLSVFPYDFFLTYKNKPVEVKKDKDGGLPYVMHKGKKLYFKKSWTNEHIIHAYRFLLAEQDVRSGHCYLSDAYDIDENSVVVDVGAAEGIFALHKIETIKHIYLIETDPEWIEALNETFKSWKEKITIINKFVSDKDDEHNLRLDTYFKDSEKIDFLKIDVDGAEQSLINGAGEVISSKVDKLAICTYHKTHDNRDFTKYLSEKKYSVVNSEGYMLFYFDPDFEPPYFRRGLIKARKIK